jgi:hypothetical protein
MEGWEEAAVTLDAEYTVMCSMSHDYRGSQGLPTGELDVSRQTVANLDQGNHHTRSLNLKAEGTQEARPTVEIGLWIRKERASERVRTHTESVWIGKGGRRKQEWRKRL